MPYIDQSTEIEAQEKSWKTSYFQEKIDVLFLVIQYLDINGWAKLCQAYGLYSVLPKPKFVEFTHKNLAVKALIEAASIEEDLEHEVINRDTFFISLANNDFKTLANLLLPEGTQTRTLQLWYPRYDTRRVLFSAAPLLEEHKYLSKDIGVARTPNYKKVKEWAKCTVRVNNETLEKLLKQLLDASQLDAPRSSQLAITSPRSNTQ